MEFALTRSALIILLLGMVVQDLSSQNPAGNLIPIFKNLGIQDGLSNNEVKQIVQDQAGFIWLATGSGIDRYDGYQIQAFLPPNHDLEMLEKLSWRPLKLVIDNNENYFIASDFAGLLVYDQKKNELIHFTSQNSDLPDNIIHSLTLDDQGMLWIATEKGIGRYDPDLRIIDQPFTNLDAIRKVLFDPENGIWMAMSDGGLIRLKDGQIDKIEKLNDVKIHSIFLTGPQALLLATDRGVLSFDISSESISELFRHSTGTVFSDIIQDEQGNVWAGTYSQGLFYYHTNEKKLYQFRHETGNRQSIVSDHIATLFEDRQGNIWIGSYGDGVSIISSNLNQIKVYFQPVANPYSGNSVSQVITSTDGDIWYHNGQDLMRIAAPDNDRTTFSIPSQILCGELHAITEFNKNLLLATDCGLFNFSPKNPSAFLPLFTQFPEIPKKNILSLSLEVPRLYIGTTMADDLEGLWIVDLEDNKTYQYRADGILGSLVGNQVTTSLTATNGDLWVGTWDDLNLYRSNIGFVSLESLIRSCECLKGGSTVISIFEDHRGLIWFGRIDNGGLIVIDPKTLNTHCFRVEDGLPDNSITTIMQDREHNIWIGTYRGAAKIEYPDDPLNPGTIRIQIIGKAEGLPNPTLWNGAIQKENDKIFFGTRDGLLEFSTKNLNINDHPPKTMLSRFAITNSETSATSSGILFPNSKPIYLRPKDKVFTIEFSAEDLYKSDITNFAYRFSNLDSNWIAIGNQHSITFANLAPDSYHFEVKAKLTNSVWGPAEHLHLIIIPPYYKRWWFIACVLGLAFWLVYAFQQERIYQLRRIHQVREEISRDLHDEIGSALSNIEIMSGMAAVSKSSNSRLFERILDTARNSNEALHQIVWNMNPANGELEIVIPYLSEYASRSLEGADINLQLHDDCIGQSIRIDVAKRKDLFLSFKEAITNIIKHSGANEVRIDFKFINQVLQISIVDNGTGIESNQEKGNGIRNMKARMERWGGKADLSKADQEGTTINLVLPLP